MILDKSIQEVRDRADIVEIVGQFISLKRRGSNYLANCPFHNERTPSFNVNPARGIFKCFGCGKAGDALTFIQEYEKFTFIEAVRWIADYYRITLEETEQTDDQKSNKQVEESLRILFEFSAQYFEHNLWHDQEGQAIGMSYFKERGFTPPVITKFRLGYALDSWTAYHEHAMKNGYQTDLLVKSSIVSEKSGKLFDTYRGRVIFPIQSNTGKVVGFGARILKSNDKAPKYLNTAENEIYNKSKILYGLFQSRNAIAQKNECILVEGYTDVISLHQHGVENVVSSSGTALTEGQLKLIKNLTKNLTILYDGDSAGIKAAIRGLELALANSFNIRLVLLPQGEDPDSFVQKYGETKFYQYLEDNKQDVIDFQINIRKEALGDATEKSALVNDLAKTISLIEKAEDFVLQQEYIRKVAQRLNTDEQGLIVLVNKYISEHIKDKQRQSERANLAKQEALHPQTPYDTTQEQTNEPIVNHTLGSTDTYAHPNKSLEDAIIKVLLKYGTRPYDKEESVLEYFLSTYDIANIEDSCNRSIVIQMEQVFQTATDALTFQKHFIQHQDPEVQAKCINLLMNDTSPNPRWETEAGIKLVNIDEEYLLEVKSTFAYFELKIIQKYIKDNLEELKNKDLTEKEIVVLMNTHRDLKQHEKSLLNLVVKPYH